MGKLKLDISMSLDGFVAGPNATLEEPLGEGGERLHEWVVGLAAWRERHGLESGTTNVDDEVLEESAQRRRGRRDGPAHVQRRARARGRPTLAQKAGGETILRSACRCSS